MIFHIRQPELTKAALSGTQDFAAAAQLQIFFGNQKTVFGLFHDVKTLMSGFAQGLPVKQQTSRRLKPAFDSSAQLVQLRQSETLGMFNHHNGGFRHIYADFNHRRRHQQFNLTAFKPLHNRVFVFFFHLAVHQSDIIAEYLAQVFKPCFGCCQVAFFGFFHQRTNPVGSGAAFDFAL